MMLADANNGVIINADSAQVYADLRVLSARPGIEDEARVPHRLFGHVAADAAYSAALWAAQARAEIVGAHGQGMLPILVGGTGLYIRTLLDGIAPIPAIDPAIRAWARDLPVAEAHRLLAIDDPAAAARLAPADTTRVARALEVVRSTGRTLADWQSHRQGGIAGEVALTPLILLPDRDWLFPRIDARLEAMFDDGAVDEVATLMARLDIPAAAPVRRAIGVREIAGMLAGSASREEALAMAQLATRQYAKRQYTWFRNQPPPDWPRSAKTDPRELIALICRERSG